MRGYVFQKIATLSFILYVLYFVLSGQIYFLLSRMARWNADVFAITMYQWEIVIVST